MSKSLLSRRTILKGSVAAGGAGLVTVLLGASSGQARVLAWVPLPRRETP